MPRASIAGRSRRAGRWERLTPLYLGDGFTASFSAPAASGHDDYVSDPAKPVPFIPRPINMGDPLQWKPWLVQRPALRLGSSRRAGLPNPAAGQAGAHHGRAAGRPVRGHLRAPTATGWSSSSTSIRIPHRNRPIRAPSRAWPDPSYRSASRSSAAAMCMASPSPQRSQPGKVEEYKFGLPNVDHVFLPGPQDHDPGAVEPVPALRPQSADLCRQYFLRATGRLQGRNTKRLPRSGHGQQRAAARSPLSRLRAAAPHRFSSAAADARPPADRSCRTAWSEPRARRHRARRRGRRAC